eukprot:3979691-Pleurochrysis_carterae.AAC.1
MRRGMEGEGEERGSGGIVHGASGGSGASCHMAPLMGKMELLLLEEGHGYSASCNMAPRSLSPWPRSLSPWPRSLFPWPRSLSPWPR